MVITKISQEYDVHIPDEFHQTLRAGQEVAVNVDAQGRLVITPIDQIRETLMESFGLWANRADLPADSVEHVNELRRGQRLDSGFNLPS